jgi:hypothetical protein
MLDNRGKLASIEGVMKDLCLKLSVTEAHHIQWVTNEERHKKLAQLVIKSLTKLLDGGEVGGTPPRPDYDNGPGSPSNALSLENTAPGGADLSYYLKYFGPPR